MNDGRPVEIRGGRLIASAGQTTRSVRLWTSDALRPVMDIPVRRETHAVVGAGDHLVVGLDPGLMAVRITSESIPIGQ